MPCAAFEVSESGTLAYSVGGQFAGQFNVDAVDRSGRVTQLFEEAASWAQPRVSPDGTSILLRRAQSPDCHLWLFDVARKSLSRVTLEGDSHDPHWVGGGAPHRRSASSAAGCGRSSLSPPMAGRRTQLAETPFPALATAVSSDGRYVALVNDDRRGRNDIWIHDRQSGATTAWLETPFDEDLAEFSPDGRWLAYTSDETGRAEVYVRPFPGPGQKFPISTQGGTGALWSRDGREIFFAEGIRLMRVAVATTPRFQCRRAGAALLERRFRLGAAAQLRRHAGRQELHHDHAPAGHRDSQPAAGPRLGLRARAAGARRGDEAMTR